MPVTDSPHFKKTFTIAYLAIVAFIALRIADYQHPVYGYTWLPQFGEKHAPYELPKLIHADHYVYPNSHGYDGQYYAQLALYPSATDPALNETSAYNHYRTRRILLSWIAWSIGGGNPDSIVKAYSFLNAFFWLGTALLLLRWLPPNSLQNLFRFSASLLTLGIVESWNKALLDGPSLFIISLGIFALEKGRPWLSALVLGIGGLAKETNILAAVIHKIPRLGKPKSIVPDAAKYALCTLPIFAWLAYLYTSVPVTNSGQSVGGGNFDFPFFAFGRAFAEAMGNLELGNNPVSLLWSKPALMVSVLVQFLFFAFYRKSDSPWWRVGASFSVLGILLGDAVWEGSATAATFRVVLPVSIAFNILLPKTKKYLSLLLLGNLTSLAGLLAFQPNPPADPSHFYPAIEEPALTQPQYIENWYEGESSSDHKWRWASGSARIDITNTSNTIRNASIFFSLRAFEAQEVEMQVDGVPHSVIKIENDDWVEHSTNIAFKPGNTKIELLTDKSVFHHEDGRAYSFCLLDWRQREQLTEHIPPITITAEFGSGWHGVETDQNSTWNWSTSTSSFEVATPSPSSQLATLSFQIRSLAPRSIAVAIDDSTETLAKIELDDTVWKKSEITMRIPAGKSAITLATAEPGTRLEGDSRELYFCVKNVAISNAKDSP